MKVARLLPVTIVVVLLVALTSWWPGAARDHLRGLEASALPTAGGEDALSATWYCAAGGADTPSAPRHTLVLSNPDDEPAPARLTAYGPDGTVGTQSVEVPAEEVERVEVAELFEADDLSVMVESPSGGLTVEHRLVTNGGADQVPCATSSSEEWYFPSQTTSQVVGEGGVVERTTAARLVLFNPFSEDAGVDVTAAVEDGLRAPSAWAGVVVPSGTIRVLDIGEHIQRREQASLSVELRNGRVIAETVQVLLDVDGGSPQPAGLRLQAGVPAPASRWAFAMGFTGQGADERLVVHNPSDRPAEVVVQVTPVGGAEMPPEPFQLEVPGRRFSIIDLSEEGRVPGRGHHTIQVESGERTPVVVARVTEVTDSPAEPEEGEEPVAVPRPSVDAGAVIGTGSPVVATNWLVPDVVVGPEHDAAVAVLNPGEGIVTVSATAFGGDDGTARVLDEVEVPAGDALVVRLSELELGGGDVGISLSSTSPVLVERVITFPRRGDFAMGTAVPVRPRGGGALTRISEL